MQATQLEIPGLESDPASQEQEAKQLRLRVDENRLRLLEALYHQAGRGEAGKSHRHCYTGLAAQFHEKLGREITSKLLACPEFKPEWLVGDLEVLTRQGES
jgi:hypothetical protein